MDAQTFEALEAKEEQHQRTQARTVYDVPRKQLWGGKITGYLFAKSLAAGAFPAAFLAYLNTEGAAAASVGLAVWPALLALVFLSVTGGLLVADLKRPERFYTILLRPNWNSWLARGTFLIVGYSGFARRVGRRRARRRRGRLADVGARSADGRARRADGRVHRLAVCAGQGPRPSG